MSDEYQLPRDREAIIEYVKRKLGYPKVNIELTPEQLVDSFGDSIRWFISGKGMVKELVMPVTADQEYILPPDVDTIIRIIPPRSGIAGIIPWEVDAAMLGYSGIPVPYMAGPDTYSGFVQEMQVAEQARRVLGGEFTWEWVPSSRKLRIYSKWSLTGSMLIEYISDKIDLKYLWAKELDLIIRRTLAEAKETLGRIRSKYPEWPMAGGAKGMDGDTLLSEAEAEKEKLDEALDGLSYPVAFLVR